MQLPAAELRDGVWVVPAQHAGPEMTLTPAPGGLKVTAVLASLADRKRTPSVWAALAKMLVCAQGSLRFARIEHDEAALRVAAFCDIDCLENDLASAMPAVATAVRLLGRETQAIFDDVVAQAYLAVHAQKASH